MKIAFCCGSLEPGRDGVGDYVRRLAGELRQRNHTAVAIALNDAHVSRELSEEQEIEGVVVPVLRLPPGMPWAKRVSETQTWLGADRPDWLSLQFVPFGYHPRGLCFGLGKRLAAIGAGARWHIMFHELWLGLGENSPLKQRLWGAWQRGIVLDCLRRLRPAAVHTQAEPYRLVLERLKIRASILPLFSNIPVADGEGWSSVLEPLVAQAVGAHLKRDELYLAGVLGAVHAEWSAAQAVDTVLPLVQQFHQRLVVVFHGKNNLSTEVFQKLKASLRDRAIIVAAGERSSEEISRILQTLDLGLATSPLQAIQKSGSATAMLEHGLPVLVTRDDWRLRGAAPYLSSIMSRILTPRDFSKLSALPRRLPNLPADTGIARVADQFLASLTPERKGADAGEQDSLAYHAG